MRRISPRFRWLPRYSSRILDSWLPNSLRTLPEIYETPSQIYGQPGQPETNGNAQNALRIARGARTVQDIPRRRLQYARREESPFHV